MNVNLYQSDVREMSDEELQRLANELAEGYCVSYTLPCECCSDSEWTDEAAERRYDAMRMEMRRRHALAFPDEAPRKLLSPTIFSRMALEALGNSLVFAHRIANLGDAKVGDTITVRRPERWAEPDAQAE